MITAQSSWASLHVEDQKEKWMLFPLLTWVDGTPSAPVATGLYDVSPPYLKMSQKACGCEAPFSADMTPAGEPVLKSPASSSVPNAHLGAYEYAFSVRATAPAQLSNFCARFNHAFAQAVNAFHVQPRQECCRPWWGGGVRWAESGTLLFAAIVWKQTTLNIYWVEMDSRSKWRPRVAACQPCPPRGVARNRLIQTLRYEWMNTDCSHNKRCCTGSVSSAVINAEVAEGGHISMTYKTVWTQIKLKVDTAHSSNQL